MKNVKFNGGDIKVNGIEGIFSQTNRGSFCHIHHCVINDDGIGCRKREFVGSIPKGVYGSPADGIQPCGNRDFGNMVVEKIEKYITRL